MGFQFLEGSISTSAPAPFNYPWVGTLGFSSSKVRSALQLRTSWSSRVPIARFSSSKVRSALQPGTKELLKQQEFRVSVPRRFDQHFSSRNGALHRQQRRQFQFLEGSISTSAKRRKVARKTPKKFQFLEGSISTSALPFVNTTVDWN